MGRQDQQCWKPLRWDTWTQIGGVDLRAKAARTMFSRKALPDTGELDSHPRRKEAILSLAVETKFIHREWP